MPISWKEQPTHGSSKLLQDFNTGLLAVFSQGVTAEVLQKFLDTREAHVYRVPVFRHDESGLLLCIREYVRVYAHIHKRICRGTYVCAHVTR